MKKKYIFFALLINIFHFSIPIIASNQEILELKDEIKNFKQINPTGSILSFAGLNAPDGWLMCNGQMVTRHQYQDLYNVIGKIYTLSIDCSVPLGEDLFCVPDLRGRVIVGVDNGVNRVISNNKLGQSGGDASVTLLIDHIPAHDHTVKCSPQTCLGGPYPGDILVPDGSPRASQERKTGSVGRNEPHNNMQPYLILNYIINY